MLWLTATDSWLLVDEMHTGASSAIVLTGQWVEIIATEIMFS